MNKFRIILTIFLFLVLNFVYAFQKSSLNWEKAKPIVSVNGQVITLLDVLRICGAEEARLPYMYEEKGLEEQIHTLRMLTLDELIKKKLVFSEFIAKGYQFPVGFMQNYLDSIAVNNKMNSMEQLKKYVEANGDNFEDLRRRAYEKAAVDSLVHHKCYKNVFITPEQIYKYYKENIDRFTIPEQVELQVLKIDRKGANRKRLASLTDQLIGDFKTNDEKVFKESVLMYSEGPATQISGNIGWIYKDKLRKDFKKALKNAEKGDIIGPVKAKEAYYFLRINNEKRKKTESYKEARGKIKSMLTTESKRKEYDEYIRALKAKANIKYL